MANPWFRLWTDMANDPKWRTIARASKQEISRVLSVYLHMMTCASNATERGRTEGWCDEDVATALDIGEDDVAAIREAMQGRVLDGDYLTGWEKRQPKREDGSAERGKAYRDRQKEEKQTQPNADERKQPLEEIRGDKKREEKSKPKSREATTASRLPPDWSPSVADITFCQTERPDLEVALTASLFRDHWVAADGPNSKKRDWSAAWRNWVRKERAHRPRAGPYESAKDKSRREAAEKLTGRKNESTVIDITPSPAQLG